MNARAAVQLATCVLAAVLVGCSRPARLDFRVSSELDGDRLATERSCFVVDARTGEPIADALVRGAPWSIRFPEDGVWEHPAEARQAMLGMELTDLHAETLYSGQFMRSASDGSISVPYPLPMLFVRKGNLIGGSRGVRKGEDGRLELPLWPDDGLQVRVVDSQERPISDIEVRLAMSTNGIDDAPLRVRTDPDGFATIPLAAATIAIHSDEMHDPDLRWRVAAAVLPASQECVELDISHLPSGPVTLRVQGKGVVEVSVSDLDGSPAPDWLPVVLAELDSEHTPDDPSGSRIPRPFDCDDPKVIRSQVFDGKAVFQHVGFGRPLLVCAARNDVSRIHAHCIPGPSESAPRVQAKIVLGRDSVVLKGRALDATGAVLKNGLLRVDLFTKLEPGSFVQFNAPSGLPEHRGRGHLSCDADGRFMLEYEFDRATGGRPTLVLADIGGGKNGFESAIDLEHDWSIGLHDLGDVRLNEAPIIAAGVVVNEALEPLSGVSVTSQQFLGGKGIHDLTDEQGRFALRSAIPHTFTQFDLRKDGYASSHVHEAIVGRTDWRISLEREVR